MPLMIFAFMNQTNIPIIYKELENRSNKTMSGVLQKGTVAALILYAMVGIFAYLSFAPTPNVIT